MFGTLGWRPACDPSRTHRRLPDEPASPQGSDDRTPCGTCRPVPRSCHPERRRNDRLSLHRAWSHHSIFESRATATLRVRTEQGAASIAVWVDVAFAVAIDIVPTAHYPERRCQ